MEKQYISIKLILDDVMLHPLLQDLSLERAVNYTAEFINRMGMPKLYLDKVAEIPILEFKGYLPCDFISIVLVRDKQGTYRSTTDTFYLKHDNHTDPSYKILGNVIISSKEKEPLEIAYKAMPTDEDGFPMIIDDDRFKKALELYIKKELFTILFDLGKINLAVLLHTELDYAWAVGLANYAITKLSYDEMESITNIWNNLIIRVNNHQHQYATSGTREYIKLH